MSKRKRRRGRARHDRIFVLHGGDHISVHGKFGSALRQAIAEMQLIWRLDHEDEDGNYEPPPAPAALWRECADGGFYVGIKVTELDAPDDENWLWPPQCTVCRRTFWSETFDEDGNGVCDACRQAAAVATAESLA